MKIALFASRLNHLKLLGPVATELLRRGHEVRYWIPGPETAGPKDDVLAYWPRLQTEGGARVGYPDTADILVTVGLRLHKGLTKGSWRKRFALDYHEEIMLHAHEGWWTDEAEVLTWTDAHARRLAAIHPGRDAHVVGFPELDQLAGMDRATCRAKYGLPSAGKILLLMPAARPHLLRPRWAGRWFRGSPVALPWAPWPGADRVPSYRQILRLIRRFADRYGAVVVAKTRAKHPPLPTWAADRVIGDESFHPFTTLELMVAADYAVGIAGGWAVEVEAAGLPHLDILGYPQDAYEHPVLLGFRREIYGRLWNRVKAYQRNGQPGRGWWWLEGWPECGEWPARDSIAHDGKASSRAADVIEAFTP